MKKHSLQCVESNAMHDKQETRFLNWVKLKKYCELSGDTPHAVHAKRRKGLWLDGVQCRIAPDGNLWINCMEVEKWVEAGNLATLKNIHQA